MASFIAGAARLSLHVDQVSCAESATCALSGGPTHVGPLASAVDVGYKRRLDATAAGASGSHHDREDRMPDPAPDTPLAALGGILATRRDTILDRWRAMVDADPLLATGASLPISQLHDHLTALLEDFERRLRSPGAAAPTRAEKGDAAAHGLHRWQQGYSLAELARELGRLNESMVEELETLGDGGGRWDAETVARARRIWASSHGIAVATSAEQFAKLQQVEAAGHVQDLEDALGALRELEAQRGALWQEAAHDLRGNLSVVAVAAHGLTRPGSPERRDRFMAALSANVRSLGTLLADVTSLARLQGGQEVRSADPMDAAALLSGLARSMEELAAERGLTLHDQGPDLLEVEGDAPKIRRVVQNLLLNALRYTEQGSVSLSWGWDPQSPQTRWFAEVRDTGPGLPAGMGARLTSALAAASGQSRLIAEAEAAGVVAHVEAGQAAAAATPDGPRAPQAPGEGIGLSIVKRLCALLDATLELESIPGAGCAFRVILPRTYPQGSAACA